LVHADQTAIQFAQAEKLYYETALITMNRDEKPEPWGKHGFQVIFALLNKVTTCKSYEIMMYKYLL